MAAWEMRNLYKGKGKAGERERRDKAKISEKKKEKKRRHLRDISLEISSSLILS